MKKHAIIAILLSVSGAIAFNCALSFRTSISRDVLASNTILQPGIFYDTTSTATQLNSQYLEQRTLQQDYFWFVQGYTQQGEFIYEKSRDSKANPIQPNRLTLVRGYF